MPDPYILMPSFPTETCRLSSPPQLSASRRNHLKTRTDPELAKILRSRISEMYKPMVPRLRVLHKTNSVPDSLVSDREVPRGREEPGTDEKIS